MPDFREQEGMMHLSVAGFLDAHQRHPRRLGAWIDFEGDGLQEAVLHPSIPQPDGERLDPMDDGSLTLEQEPCPFGRTRHQGLFVLV